MTEHGYVDGPVFRIRFHLSTGWVTLTAWEGGFQAPNHTRLNCELRQGGKVVFAKGDLFVGIPGCIDDNSAKESVGALFALRPGDTDREFFDSYTPEQLKWVTDNGEELGMLVSDRYCDPETGAVRR